MQRNIRKERKIFLWEMYCAMKHTISRKKRIENYIKIRNTTIQYNQKSNHSFSGHDFSKGNMRTREEIAGFMAWRQHEHVAVCMSSPQYYAGCLVRTALIMETNKGCA